jgi:glyoxylase-like metal-dependent hydrolase (beta-lactamase superfamily II)
MKEYYIRPILITEGPRDMSQYTYLSNFGESVPTAHYVFYIEGSEPKTVVDAGVTAEMNVERGRTVEKNVQSLEEGFGKLGLKLEDIGKVILTHLHWDHVGLAHKYPAAKFVTQKAELDFTMNPHPYGKSFEKKLIEGLDFDVVEGDAEILDGISVILTPGHTPAGQSIVVNTPKGTAIIAGLCTISENFFPPETVNARGLPVVPPAIHINVLEAYDSVLKIKQTADIVIPLHDFSLKNKDRIPD